jgi:hypothetical protein
MTTTKKPVGPGRPNKFKSHERWNRTTVVLRDWEVAFLDRLAADIREKSGVALNRSDMMRECINVLFLAHETGMLNLDIIEGDKHWPAAQLNALVNQGWKKK